MNNFFLSISLKIMILHQTTCINTPEQNDISERKNRHILEITRFIIFQMNVPKNYLSEAILTAVHLMNRLPIPVLKNKSPLEILENRKITLDHLRVFGCTYFVHKKDKISLITMLSRLYF
jgi:hypothetical protein